jgi:uncharacterized protein (TIRG00374 family)
MITPGQLGEFVKVLYHRREGFPIPESILSVLIDRAYDLLMLLLFGFVAMAVLFGLSPTLTIAISAGASIALLIGFLFARNKESSARWMATALARISPKAYKETMQENAFRLTRQIGEFSIGFLLACGLLTIANYIVLMLRVYVLVLALHLEVPFWYFVMVMPLIRLVGLLPISISGIGTRDITMIYLFGQVGIPQEASLVLSMLGLITVQFQTFVGLLAWWRHPLQLGKRISPLARKSQVKRESEPFSGRKPVPSQLEGGG